MASWGIHLIGNLAFLELTLPFRKLIWTPSSSSPDALQGAPAATPGPREDVQRVARPHRSALTRDGRWSSTMESPGWAFTCSAGLRMLTPASRVAGGPLGGPRAGPTIRPQDGKGAHRCCCSSPSLRGPGRPSRSSDSDSCAHCRLLAHLEFTANPYIQKEKQTLSAWEKLAPCCLDYSI